MSIVTILDAHAKPGERGHVAFRPLRVTVNGRELRRCTLIVSLFGFGVARFYVAKDGQLQVRNGQAVEGVTFGRIKVEQLAIVEPLTEAVRRSTAQS